MNAGSPSTAPPGHRGEAILAAFCGGLLAPRLLPLLLRDSMNKASSGIPCSLVLTIFRYLDGLCEPDS